MDRRSEAEGQSLVHAGLPWRRFSFLRRLLALFAGVVALCVMPRAAAAQGPVGPQTLSPTAYMVRPGDTLSEIAEQYGVTVAALADANGIQNPRHLYPGQALLLSPGAGALGAVHRLAWGETLLTLSRAAGVTPAALARHNGLLLPTGLRVGYALWLPQRLPVQALPEDASAQGAGTPAPRISAAVRAGARLWDVLWLNPQPHIAMQALLIPGSLSTWATPPAPAQSLPYPVTSLSVSSQPVARGETVVAVVETAEPVSCVVSYLDQVEACVGDTGAGQRWVGLAGLSPLLDPGIVTLTLTLTPSAGDGVVVRVPVLVGAGSYDYERIDLPPDRESLLDPELSQAERGKIATLRLLRSPERDWTYPFVRPVDAAITSYFGSRRSYGYGFGSFHAGSDFDGLGGEPVSAPADGVVVLAEPLVVRGNAILIDHGWGVVSGFWHLSEIAVTVGDRVTQGQRIGALGNTGLSTGAHLHWELWVNGGPVNALSWLEPDGPAAMLGARP